MLLNHQTQVEAVELANQRAKHQLQSRHLKEKCAFFDAEQKRFEDLQLAEFEKEARQRRKMLAKELKVCIDFVNSSSFLRLPFYQYY